MAAEASRKDIIQTGAQSRKGMMVCRSAHKVQTKKLCEICFAGDKRHRRCDSQTASACVGLYVAGVVLSDRRSGR